MPTFRSMMHAFGHWLKLADTDIRLDKDGAIRCEKCGRILN